MSEIKGLLYDKDLSTLMVFNNSIKCRFLDRVMPLVTYIGSAAVTVSTCLMIIGLGNDEVRRIGIQTLVTLTFSHLLVHLLKNSICRLRPKDVLHELNTFDVRLDYYSFPSGHATAAFAIAATLTFYFPMLGLICFPIALIVAVSRLYLGVHYPSDVLAGIAVAILSSTVIHLIVNRFF